MNRERVVVATQWFIALLLSDIVLLVLLEVVGADGPLNLAVNLAIPVLILGYVGLLLFWATGRTTLLARRVAREGRAAEATVLAAEFTGYNVESGGPPRYQLALRLRVEPADGSPFEAVGHVMREEFEARASGPGARMAVRYLPRDRDEVIVDSVLRPADPSAPAPSDTEVPVHAARPPGWALPVARAAAVALPLGLLAGGVSPPAVRLAARLGCPEGTVGAFWAEVSATRAAVLCEAADGTRLVGDPPVLLVAALAALASLVVLAVLTRAVPRGLLVGSVVATAAFGLTFAGGFESPRAQSALAADGGYFLRGSGALEALGRVEAALAGRRLVDLRVEPLSVSGRAVSADGTVDGFRFGVVTPVEFQPSSDLGAGGLAAGFLPADLAFGAFGRLATTCVGEVSGEASGLSITARREGAGLRLRTTCRNARRASERAYAADGTAVSP